MSAQNVALVRGVYDAMKRGDIDTVVDFYEPQGVCLMPGPAELPYSGRWQGRSEIRKCLVSLTEAFEWDRFDINELLAVNDKVIALGEDETRLKMNGASCTCQFAHVWTIRNDKAVRFQEYADTSHIVSAMQSGKPLAPAE